MQGKPEYVENFMKFIAEELREYMAKLGRRTVDEMVGRSDLLKVREDLTGREKDRSFQNFKQPICIIEGESNL